MSDQVRNLEDRFSHNEAQICYADLERTNKPVILSSKTNAEVRIEKHVVVFTVEGIKIQYLFIIVRDKYGYLPLATSLV